MKTTEKVRAQPDALARLIGAAGDMSPIVGYTHNFYRYPARFSPKLVRAAIDAFTEPGDLVLDPFVGGGTTLVEAMVSGRHAIGTDISSLATFVAEVKTTIYTEGELERLARWAARIGERGINIWTPVPRDEGYEAAGYTKHLDGIATWRLKRCIEYVLDTARRLESKTLENFARCVALRTAQWALNGRKNIPSINDFRDMIVEDATMMIAGARELREAVLNCGYESTAIQCLNRTATGLQTDGVFAGRVPRLIVTSPPYPGVHILYHRWQVDGRKETPAPFWIANRLDGDGAAYYTMGARTKELNSYFANLKASLESVAAVCDRDTMIVQVVAFTQPEWQLPRYLSVADDVGMTECFLPGGTGAPDGRLWRTVPNRRWYADQRGVTNGSQEVVLFHRRKL